MFQIVTEWYEDQYNNHKMESSIQEYQISFTGPNVEDFQATRIFKNILYTDQISYPMNSWFI